MAQSLGSLVVSLGLDAAAFTSGLTKSEQQARQSMRSIQREVEGIREGFSKVGRAIAFLSGGALTFGALIHEFGRIKEATTEGEKSVLQLDAALKATGNSAGLTAADLEKLGRAVKASSTFEDNDIRAAETALLRFRDIRREVFDEAIRAAPDLAVALGIGLPEAATKLGRALEDPAKGMRGLREAGVFLSETQTALAVHFSELGEKAKAQKIVMDAVAASTGGAALAATKGLGGATDRLARSFKELEEAVGKKLFGDTHGLAASLQKIFEDLRKEVDKSSFSLSEFLTNAAKLSVIPVGAGLLDDALRTASEAQRTSKGTIRNAPESSVEQEVARAKAAQAELDRALDTQNVKRFDSLKSFAEKSAQFYASDTALQKHNLTVQTSNIEFAYSQGKTATAEFYGAQVSLARKSFDEQDRIFTKRVQAEEAIIRSQLSTQADRDAARGRIAGIVAQADTVRLSVHEKLNKIAQEEIVAIEKLRDSYAELGAVAAETAGDFAAAATTRFDISNRNLRQQLESDANSPDPVQASLAIAGIAAVNAQREQISNLGKLTRATQEYSIVVEDIGNAQARIDLLAQTGALTEIEAINKRADLARKYVDELRRLADVQASLAAGLAPGPAQEAALQELARRRLEIDALAASVDVLAKKFNDIGSGATTTFLTDLISGTKSVKQAFIDMAKTIEQQISRIAAQNISETLFKNNGPLGGFGTGLASLFGTKTAAKEPIGTATVSGVGADAVITSLGTAATAAELALGTFTPAVGASELALATFAPSVSTADGGLVTLYGSLTLASDAALTFAASASKSAVLSSIPTGGGGGDFLRMLAELGLSGFAGGGDPPVGKISIVGERGPELFIPKIAGTIIPANTSAEIVRRFTNDRAASNIQAMSVAAPTLKTNISDAAVAATAGLVNAAANVVARLTAALSNVSRMLGVAALNRPLQRIVNQSTAKPGRDVTRYFLPTFTPLYELAGLPAIVRRQASVVLANNAGLVPVKQFQNSSVGIELLMPTIAAPARGADIVRQDAPWFAKSAIGVAKAALTFPPIVASRNLARVLEQISPSIVVKDQPAIHLQKYLTIGLGNVEKLTRQHSTMTVVHNDALTSKHHAIVSSAAPSGDDFLRFLTNLGISRFATGGNPPLNRPSLIGEDGPELWIPRSAGTILPNSEFSSSGTRDIIVNQTINVLPGATRQAASQAGAEAGRGVRRALVRET